MELYLDSVDIKEIEEAFRVATGGAPAKAAAAPAKAPAKK